MKYPDLGNSQRSTPHMRGDGNIKIPGYSVALDTTGGLSQHQRTTTPRPMIHLHRLVRQDTGPVLHLEITRLVEIGPPGRAGARSPLQPGDALPEDLEFPQGQCGTQRIHTPSWPPPNQSRENSGAPLSTIYRPLSFPQAVQLLCFLHVPLGIFNPVLARR